MRQVALDTETTGLETSAGHRIIEIACLEMVDRRLTGNKLHYYVNPQRPIDPGATRVHGITDEDVAYSPLFERIADELLGFVSGAEVLIHNAPFDLGFLNVELALSGKPRFESCCDNVFDTLKFAREKRPRKKNDLDTLCIEYDIKQAPRKLHGALLDAHLLADVYLAMTRGQESLVMDLQSTWRDVNAQMGCMGERPPLHRLTVSAEEKAAHEALLADIDKATKGACLWLQDLSTNYPQ